MKKGIKKVLIKILTTFHKEGLAGVFQKSVRWTKWCWAKWRWGFTHNNWVVGKCVELAGDKAYIKGLLFHLDNECIRTSLKSRFFFRTYESQAVALAEEFVPKDLPVIELGGSLGVVSCVVNRRLDSPKQHVVLETNRMIIPALEKNRDVNLCQFSIINGALAYGCDTIDFCVNRHFFLGGSFAHQDSEEIIHVPAYTLKGILSRFAYDEDYAHIRY